MEDLVLINYKEFAFLLKTQKQPLWQVTGGNAPNLVLNRMQEHFLKILPLQKMLGF